MRSKEERRQEMFALIEQSQSSGQTNKEFCQEHGISPAVFYYWQKRYRQ
ncbi:MAG: IS66 family insertion sequence element accessory protein TnpA, partial [Bacillota bacterium]